MYGLWVYKEIQTEYGYCKVEIYRKGYSGSQIEIGALAEDSLTLALENLNEITAPIGKSVCSFSIIDTEQVEYDDFFTPDATALKVVVSTKIGTGEYTTRWSGYVTPDFFAENLTYRTPISLSARDNIGYLNDVDFDLVRPTITIRELITAAFAKIATDYPMSLTFASQKQTAEGVLAIDATISTALLKGGSWYEAIKTVLHDLGLQMRWVDNNTIAVIDLSQIPEYYATQGFNFIGASGYREILPAWRQLSQSQDYGLRENFFEGEITSDDVSYVREEVLTSSGPVFTGAYQTSIKYYQPSNWARVGTIYTINPSDYLNGDILFKDRIYFTGIKEDNTNYSNHYISWRQPIYKSNWPLQVTFKALNAVLAPDTLGLSLFPPTLYSDSEDNYQIGLKANILLHCGATTYILKQNWEILSGVETTTIEFLLPKITAEGSSQEEEINISITQVPQNGELELRIYGFFLNSGNDNNVAISTDTFVKMVSYISDITYTYDTSTMPTGQDASTLVNELHNVKNGNDYTFGQVPLDCGGINAYAGGLYTAYGDELVGFQRNAEGSNYNLLELVGREIIHFNKKNYNKLSGTIKNLDKEPLMFNRLLVREGKTYMPFAASLNVISNKMNITTMQEVDPYTTESFTEINSEVVTGGGATVGGGNNTVLRYSEEAGNAKRIYELSTATETEKNNAYLILDSSSFSEAKKVHISEVKDAELRADFNTLRSEFDALSAVLNSDVSGKINTWNEVVDFLDEYSGSQDLATILSAMNADIAKRALQTSLDTTNANLTALTTRVTTAENSITSVSNKVKTFEDIIGIDSSGDVYIKKKSDGTARNFYTYGDVISGGEGDGSSSGSGSGGSTVSWANSYTSANGLKIATISIDGVDTPVYTAKNLSAYTNDSGYITGITSAMVTTALGYTPYNSASFTKANIKSTLGISDWALATSKPSYSWSEIGSKPTFATVATSGKYSDLSGTPTIPTSLKSPYALTFGSKTYDGSVAKTILASDLGALTTHQTIYALTIKNSAGTTQTTYTPNSAAASITLTKAMVGLGDVENTALSTWAGSSKITTLGTITSGTWNGTKIANAYLANSSVTISGTAVSLGGSITQAALRTALGLGSNAYTSTAYLPLSGGTIIGDYGALSIKRNNAYASLIQFENTGGILGYLGFNSANIPVAYTSDAATMYTLIHTGNIGSYNAGSATKLQTARTIWGQSFDGTGNVDGNMNIEGSITMSKGIVSGGATSGAYLGPAAGLGSGYTGALIYAYGANPIYLYTNATSRMIINSSGNVLIGTTTDSGGKLQVNGSVRVTGEWFYNTTAGTGLYNSAGDARWYYYSDFGGWHADKSIQTTLRYFACSGYTGSSWGNGAGALNVNITDNSNQTPLIVAFRKGSNPATAGSTRLFAMELINSSTVMRWYFGSTNAYQFTSGGNFIATGEVTSGSDARYKSILSHADIDIKTIANAPIINFKWTDREDDKVHLGSTAQYWYGTAFKNGVIPTDDEKLWTMGYGQIALASVVSVAKKVVNHEERVKILEKRVNELETELEQYRRA